MIGRCLASFARLVHTGLHPRNAIPAAPLGPGKQAVRMVGVRPDPNRDPRVRLALYQPDIPQNAGTMLRLAACLGVTAVIVEPAGFPVGDRDFRRAGMDYLAKAGLERHVSFEAFERWRGDAQAAGGRHRLILLTTRSRTAYWEFGFDADDILLVGRESAGVPEAVHAAADARLAVPLMPGLRSLNVATAGAMVLGEALRQTRGFPPFPAGSP